MISIEPVAGQTAACFSMLTRNRVALDEVDAAWVSRDPSGLVAGAAYLTRSWTGGAFCGPGLWVEVMPEQRGSGHGAALVDAARRHSVDLGARAIHSIESYRAEDVSEAIRRLGFTSSITAHEFELDARLVFKECDRLIKRREARHGGVGMPLTTKPLASCSADERAQAALLQRRHLGGGEAEVEHRLAGRGADAFHGEVSTVLCDTEGRIVGCALFVESVADQRPGVVYGTLETIVVDPSLRLSLATPLLKRAVAESYTRLGGGLFTLRALDAHRDTKRQAERLGARLLGVLEQPFMPLGDGPPYRSRQS